MNNEEINDAVDYSEEETEAYLDTFANSDIAILTDICHQNALKAGWWNDPNTGEDLRGNPYAIAAKLALIHSEVSEAVEGHRRSAMDDKLPHRSAIEVELVDVIVRVFDLAGALNLDLGGAFVEKLNYNNQRKDHKVENRKKAGGKLY